MSAPKKDDILKLRTAVFEILRTDESETLPMMKDLKAAVMDKLRMDKANVAAAPNADMLASIVEEYKNLNSKKNQQAQQLYAADDGMRKKKFSKYESDFIMSCIRDYVASETIEMKELCANLREAHDKQHKHHKIWNDLATYLPYRQRVAIRQHAVRQIMREHGGERSKGFTPEDKEQLKKLVEERGQEWSTIGRLMCKLDDDCKHMYLRMQGRKVTGKFSQEEDQRLLRAVRVVGQTQGFCTPETPVCDMPEKGISWKKVAEEMDKERQPLDYLRRWPFTKRLLSAVDGQGPAGADGDKKAKKNPPPVVDGVLAPMMKKQVAISREAAGADQEMIDFTLRWLEEVNEFSAENESEVIWAEIDKSMNLPYSYSTKKWRAMRKATAGSESLNMPTILAKHLADFRKDAPSGSSSSSGGVVSGIPKPLPVAAATSRRASQPGKVARPVVAPRPPTGLAVTGTAPGTAPAVAPAVAVVTASSSSSSSSSSAAAPSSMISNLVSAAASGVMSMIGRSTAAATEASLPVDEPSALNKAKKSKVTTETKTDADDASSPKPLPLDSGRAGKKRAAEADADESDAPGPSAASAAAAAATALSKPLKKRPHDEMLAASALVGGPEADDKKKEKKAKTDGAAADKKKVKK